MSVLANLLTRMDDTRHIDTAIIPWSSPVPSFGDLSRSRVATLGLNPSCREFLDGSGNELADPFRRFHTLRSLKLQRWADADSCHMNEITTSCQTYFANNPYDQWFKRLDVLIAATMTSYYSDASVACHLDLIPYATRAKWMQLRPDQRSSLFAIAGNTLGILLRDSPVRLLILNGRSVVDHFEAHSGLRLTKIPMPEWSLARRDSSVPGFAYEGRVPRVSGIDLGRELTVIGFNHNIQSSYGVTKSVVAEIGKWIGRVAEEVL